MFGVLADLAERPACFSVLTARRLWTDPYLSKQMLRCHLDAGSTLASRRPREIQGTADWLDRILSLTGKQVCDLGCGPGLYAREFHDRGAIVCGIDWSASSLEYARAEAAATGRKISYVQADYTNDPLPGNTDLFTLIYGDYCALSPSQRRSLLHRVRDALGSHGRIALDVWAMRGFESFSETASVERRLMGGFWSAGDYVGVKKTIKYEPEKVTLERFLIVEPDRHWNIFNWLQYFTLQSLTRELNAANFDVEHAVGALTGEPLTDSSDVIAVVARAS